MKILKGLEEGQVLQRLGSLGATVRLSGEVAQAGPILATLSTSKGTVKGWKARVAGRSRAGKFLIELSGIPTGGPYRLELRAGKEKVSVRAFFVGDVWVLAGASNMQGIGNMTGAAKPHPLIRAFSLRRVWRLATDPIHVYAESPDACLNSGVHLSPEAAEKFRREAIKGVGPGIFFAREMLQKSGVPQGLIAAAYGGASMVQWDPGKKDGMYASMLRSVRATGQPVAGVLWYQGATEHSPEDVSLYTERMKMLVAAARRDFRQLGVAWVIVQMGRVFDQRDPSFWNPIQEQQRLLPCKIRNLETVAAIDLPLDDRNHIGSEGAPILGARLAYAAGRLVYGGKKRPPQLKTIIQKKSRLEGEYIDVIFDSVEKGLQAIGQPQGFKLVNRQGTVTISIYNITLHGNVVRLHCWSLSSGLFLYYGHGLTPYCNITDGRGLSLPVFGPIEVGRPTAGFPFVKVWKTTDVVAASKPLGEIDCPDLDALDALQRAYKKG